MLPVQRLTIDSKLDLFYRKGIGKGVPRSWSTNSIWAKREVSIEQVHLHVEYREMNVHAPVTAQGLARGVRAWVVGCGGSEGRGQGDQGKDESGELHVGW